DRHLGGPEPGHGLVNGRQCAGADLEQEGGAFLGCHRVSPVMGEISSHAEARTRFYAASSTRKRYSISTARPFPGRCSARARRNVEVTTSNPVCTRGSASTRASIA